jgi:hypothetical protein
VRVPPFERYVRFLSGLGLMLAGAVIGSALFMGIYQQNFNFLVMENEKLRSENKQLAEEVDTLNKYKNRQSMISKINVNVEKTGDEGASLSESIETEIRGRVYDDLKVLLGQPIATITANPLIFQNLVDKKIYANVYEKDYIVSLKTMLVTPGQLTVWVTIRAMIRN